ncbi:MAG: hypothetical protein Q4G64_04060 [bacterium]|nr:hypothetical protein [bacterium]
MDAKRAARAAEPRLDPEIHPGMLDGLSRRSLRSLNKENADMVARHLVASGLAIDDDPELAYQHALAAQRRAGRIDVVREAVATTAYVTGRYTEALREARTVRRLSGDDSLRVIEADSERGLGRPEKALAIINEVDLSAQPAELRAELAIVASGARADMGDHEAGLLAVEEALRIIRANELRARLLSVRADRLEELGRDEDAQRAREESSSLEPEVEEEESVLFIDDTLDPELDAQLNAELALAVQLEEADPGAQHESAIGHEDAAADTSDTDPADESLAEDQPQDVDETDVTVVADEDSETEEEK